MCRQREAVPIRICPNCAKITPEGKFCEHCGALLEGALSTTVSRQPAPVVPVPTPGVKKESGFLKAVFVIGIILVLLIVVSSFFPFMLGIASLFDTTRQSPTLTGIPSPTATKDDSSLKKSANFVVSSYPGGAQVTLDGVSSGTLVSSDSRTFWVSPGFHRISVSLPGYTTYTQTATLKSGQSVSVYAKLWKFDTTPVSSGASKSWHTLSTSKVQIEKGHYRYYNPELKAGEIEKISISTDGAPVDLMVMQASDFDGFVNAVSSGGSWYSLNSPNIIKDDYILTAPYDGTFYFVIDNTPWPDNGANAGRDIAAEITFSQYY